jgi:hypothetical protein
MPASLGSVPVLELLNPNPVLDILSLAHQGFGNPFSALAEL